MSDAASRGQPLTPALELAVESLLGGLVVAIPTDTVYGLAVDPSQPGATRRLFDLKRRPESVALPVLVSGVEQAVSLAVPGPVGSALMERWWPGGLTLVMARRPGLGLELGGDEATIGIRCPAHPVPLALMAMVGPLATTSANRHGAAPLRTAQDVSAELGPEVAAIIDAGACGGSPSTVVDCTGPQPTCLREGGIGWDRVLASLAQ